MAKPGPLLLLLLPLAASQLASFDQLRQSWLGSSGTPETIRSRLSPAQYEVMEDREDRSLANTYPFNHVARQSPASSHDGAPGPQQQQAAPAPQAVFQQARHQSVSPQSELFAAIREQAGGAPRHQEQHGAALLSSRHSDRVRVRVRAGQGAHHQAPAHQAPAAGFSLVAGFGSRSSPREQYSIGAPFRTQPVRAPTPSLALQAYGTATYNSPQLLSAASAPSACPVMVGLPLAQCRGAVNTCWSVGQTDVDCPNSQLCCFDGCANTCHSLHHAPAPLPAPVRAPIPASTFHLPAPASAQAFHHQAPAQAFQHSAPAPAQAFHHQASAPAQAFQHSAPAPAQAFHHQAPALAPAFRLPAPAPAHHHPAPAPAPFVEHVAEHLDHVVVAAPAPRLPASRLPPRNPFQARQPASGTSFREVAAAPQKCIDKIETVEEIEYDEVEQCDHSYDRKCHTTYVTEYESQQEEECEDNYKKSCDITYSPQANNVTVQVCMRPLVKDCNLAGPEICRTEYISECWTKNDPHLVEDDVPRCQTVYDEKCEQTTSGYVTEEDCKKWPREVCTITRERKQKFNPVTKCEKVPQQLCGPSGCGFVQGPEICHDETKTVVTDIPNEVCDLQPQRSCEHVTKLVPKLSPVEECSDVPKEICTKGKANPRTVLKPITKKWCYNPSEESGLA